MGSNIGLPNKIRNAISKRWFNSEEETIKRPNNICQHSISDGTGPHGLGGVCCYRETWSDTNHCIWHADASRKPVEELASTRKRTPERIDNAIIKNSSLGDVIDFEECTLYNSNFSSSNLNRANFEGSDIRSADFSGAQIESANFSHTLGSRTNFKIAELDGVNSTTQNTLMESSHVITQYLFTTFPNLTSPMQIYFDAKFHNTPLSNAEFRDSILIHSEFTEAELRGTDFSGADARDVDFMHARLDGAYLNNSRLSSSTTFGEKCADERIADARAIKRPVREKIYFDIVRLLATLLYKPYFRIRKQIPNEPTNIVVRLLLWLESGYNAHILDNFPPAPNYNRGIDRKGSVEELMKDPSRFRGIFISVWRFYNRLSPEFGFRERDNKDLQAAERTCQLYQSILEDTARKQDVVNYELREKHVRRKRMWSQGHYWEWIKIALSRWSIGYGERPWRIIFWSGFSILLPAILYPVWGLYLTGEIPGARLVSYTTTGSLCEIISTSLYFSSLLFAGVGDGDAQPLGIGQWLMSLQSLLGPISLALIVFVLTRRATK